MELEFLNWIQTLRSPTLDAIMAVASTLGDRGYIWIAIMAIFLAFPQMRRIGAVICLALVMDFVLCNEIIKPIINRARPCDVNTLIELLVKRPSDSSFPSGHTTAAFASASAMFFAGEKRKAAAAGVLAVFIAISRMYCYMHYPTDVLAGVVLGILFGWLSYLIVGKVEKRLKRKTDLAK